jgi:hypothetical protein
MCIVSPSYIDGRWTNVGYAWRTAQTAPFINQKDVMRMAEGTAKVPSMTTSVAIHAKQLGAWPSRFEVPPQTTSRRNVAREAKSVTILAPLAARWKVLYFGRRRETRNASTVPNKGTERAAWSKGPPVGIVSGSSNGHDCACPVAWWAVAASICRLGSL